MKKFFVVGIPVSLSLHEKFDFGGKSAIVRSIFDCYHTHLPYNVLVGRVVASGQLVWGPVYGGKAVLTHGHPDINGKIVQDMIRELEGSLQKQKEIAASGHS